MNPTLIEAIGYAGSLLVLISLLMTSVVKLRILNTVGSAIFCAYAVIIQSWPTAVMNFCLVLINLYFLWKLGHTKKSCTLLELDEGERFLAHFLEKYGEDIRSCFPDADLHFEKSDRSFLVLCEEEPAGLTVGALENGIFTVKLDYSTPKYRDFSIGRFLLTALPDEGVSELRCEDPAATHKGYLTKMGYEQQSDSLWVRKL